MRAAALAGPTAARGAPGDYAFAQRSWAIAAVAFLALFFALPLIENAFKSVTVAEAAHDPLFYYAKLLTDPYYRGVLGQTLWVSFVVTVACLLLSYPVAYYLVRDAGRAKPVVVFLLIAPLLTSVIMRTLGIRLLLARQGVLNWLLDGIGLGPLPPGWLNGPVSVYIGMIHVLIPFMVLSIAPVIERIEPSLEEAATVLGAGAMRTFVHVTLPLSREGIYTGCILVFMMSNGSFVTQLLLGAGKVVTMPVLIFQQFNVTQDTAFASAMGNTLLLMSIACLVLQSTLTRPRPPMSARTRRAWRSSYVWAFLALIALPIVLVVVVSFAPTPYLTFPLPALSLTWYRHMFGYAPFIDALGTSLKLAIASSVAGALLAVPCALALAHRTSRGAAATINILLAPISIPGVVFGFALLYFLSARTIGPGFLSLFIAHTCVAIPYISRTVLSVYRTVPESIEEAAIVLGASRGATLLFVTLPQLRQAIFSGMLFACLISFDNLPISYFFGTASTNTLPVVMLSYLQNQFDPSIAAIATVQMLLAVGALVAGERLFKLGRVRSV